ncbi:MAG TPA: glutamate--tRNA ligase [Saprospiraceae bacterium]|nr:glutamate--tRNA ligase [Saprospiraceae bacterium]HMQ82993.1 glutamate--tRNA ligase [Saprospiraceae bacterium]
MNKIRVRFAPSPTGALHIGGVRTALYNYLLAKKLNGDFILRIEDTDQTRYVPGAEDYIKASLEWLGLLPDEGPGYGGTDGPYRQSERKAIYQQYAQQLIDTGRAYYAFDTEAELDTARSANPSFKYDASIRLEMRNTLSLSKAESDQFISSGQRAVIRLKVEPGREVRFEDRIRGAVSFQTDELDDKVLLKADGMPTYHLANIIDDHLMKITHVIRGEEWLSSTAHHVLLYEAFDWADTMPEFAHLPLILKPAPASFLTPQNLDDFSRRFTEEFFKKYSDFKLKPAEEVRQYIRGILVDKDNLSARVKVKDKDSEDKVLIKAFLHGLLFGKLSKRDGDRLGFPVFPLSWEDEKPENSFIGFREFGFLPAATINFLALVGWNPGSEQEIFSLTELCELFDLDKVGKSGARFDFPKARWFNQQYMIHASAEMLAPFVRPIITAKGHEAADGFLHAFIDLMKERTVVLSDFWDNGAYFFEDPTEYDQKNVSKRWQADRNAAFVRLSAQLEALADFSAEGIKGTVEAFMEKEALKFGDVLPLLRIAIAGTMQGPAIFDVMALIGKEATGRRLKKAITTFDTFI